MRRLGCLLRSTAWLFAASVTHAQAPTAAAQPAPAQPAPAQPAPAQPAPAQPAPAQPAAAAPAPVAPAAPPAPTVDPKTIPPDPGTPGASEYEQALRAQDPAEAQALFEKASKAAGGNCAALFSAGVMAERGGKPEVALKLYADAMAVKQDCGPALVNTVTLQMRNGKVADAAALSGAALSRTPDEPLTRVAAGLVAMAQGKATDAEDHAKKALKKDEKNVEAMRLLARAYYAAKKYDLVTFVLKRASDIEPQNALVHQELGLTYLQMKPERSFRAAAKQAFERAVSIRTDLPESQNNLAVLYGEGGDNDAALAAATRAVELRPDSALAWLNQGNALRAIKKYTEALAAYQKVLELDPTMTEVQYNLGIMHLDNEIPGMDEVDRLGAASKYLGDYLAKVNGLSADEKEKVEQYVRENDRNRERIVKKRAKDKKKAEDQAKKEAEKKAQEEADAKAKEEADKAAAEKAAADKAAADKAAADKAAEDKAAADKAAADKAAADKAAADKAAADKAAKDEADKKKATPPPEGAKPLKNAEEPPAEPAPPPAGGDKPLKKADEPPPAAPPPPPAEEPKGKGKGKGKKGKPLKKAAEEAPPPADDKPANKAEDSPPPAPPPGGGKLGKGK